MDVKQQHFNYNIRIQVQDFFLFSVSFYPKYPNFNNWSILKNQQLGKKFICTPSVLFRAKLYVGALGARQ